MLCDLGPGFYEKHSTPYSEPNKNRGSILSIPPQIIFLQLHTEAMGRPVTNSLIIGLIWPAEMICVLQCALIT
jgi:hypothetical protein